MPAQGEGEVIGDGGERRLRREIGPTDVEVVRVAEGARVAVRGPDQAVTTLPPARGHRRYPCARPSQVRSSRASVERSRPSHVSDSPAAPPSGTRSEPAPAGSDRVPNPTLATTPPNDLRRAGPSTETAFTAADHPTFSLGRHFFPGAMLSLAEVEVATNQLLDAIPDMRLAAGAMVGEEGAFVREVPTLPLGFTPVTAS